MKQLPPPWLALAALALGAPALAETGHVGHPAPKAAASTAAPKAALPLRVQNAAIVAVPPGVKDTAAHMVLINPSARAVKLTGVSTPVARHAMLMNTVMTGKMMGMRETKALTVPARGQLALKNDGDHLMLMGLWRPLKVGEQVTLTLHAADGRTFKLSATVRKP
ncbi:hypothetical protein SAMN04488058_101373 [Deinococcus reticulitermitis]|uniref:Copper(I)-binding protein n=1 Tax=Deinococcus reticulitermitis TaxID=856736 RepID=A0A1H6SPM7_9DEIO|nr:copper chaperone PCu(A)C [Deinococcus reticulitermitis]SEI69771.1 hypothetical protein SAMN04488058_101373 [Deinococcus reticulitermitis]